MFQFETPFRYLGLSPKAADLGKEPAAALARGLGSCPRLVAVATGR